MFQLVIVVILIIVVYLQHRRIDVIEKKLAALEDK